MFYPGDVSYLKRMTFFLYHMKHFKAANFTQKAPPDISDMPRQNVFFPPHDAEKPNTVTIHLDFEKSRSLRLNTCSTVMKLVLRDASSYLKGLVLVFFVFFG